MRRHWMNGAPGSALGPTTDGPSGRRDRGGYRNRSWTGSALLIALWFAAPGGAQETTAAPDLASLFSPGQLVTDVNGDGVPDGLGATLVLPQDASPALLAAATEVATRLGFETSALDLPLAYGADPDRIAIVFGDAGWTASGLGGSAPEATGGSPAFVATGEQDGQRWVFVGGSTDEEVRAAARMLAGALPHTRALSDPDLTDMGDGIDRWLRPDTTVQPNPFRVAFSRAAQGDDGWILDASLGHSDVTALETALQRLDSLAGARSAEAEISDSTTLRYPGVDVLRITRESGDGAAVLLPGGSPPPEPGPISGRPGSGARNSMDLSNVFTKDGALADSDNNEIPDRIDVILVPGGAAAEGLPALGARLGLESTGITVPLVRTLDEIDRAASEPTMVLVGTEHSLIDQLADSGKVTLDGETPGTGWIELVPKAFGSKPALVVTGSDVPGARSAVSYAAEGLPYLSERRSDAPTLDTVEEDLWGLLNAHSPAGQAATALYKLDRILGVLTGEASPDQVSVLVSVEKPEGGLEEAVRDRVARAGLAVTDLTIDNRDVQAAATLLDETLVVPWEVDRFRQRFRDEVMPRVSAGSVVQVEARLSEPPELRRELAAQVRDELLTAGADPASSVRILSAFKQGYFWLDEVIKPQLEGEDLGEIVISFRKNEPPEEWPHQAILTPLRWLHEIYPIDEVLARDLDLPLDRIRYEMVEDGPIYAVSVRDGDGREILSDTFEPRWVLRPYFDRFDDYERVRVTTGSITAQVNRASVLDERIVTDPEWVWDHFQSSTLPALWDYVMDRHEGEPRGGGRDAPYFGELTVEIELSEPDYRLGIDNEIISPMDALHEEVYFGTIEFFHLIGRNARGADLTYPGRILPYMRPRGEGGPGSLRTRLTGFATQRPAVVVRYEGENGREREERLDIAQVDMERPSVRRAILRPQGQDGTGEPHPAVMDLAFRVRVDTDGDVRDSLLDYATPLRVDESMISAAQVSAVLSNLEELRGRGAYRTALSYDGVGEIEVWAEWTHEQDPEARRTTTLAPNGAPAPLPRWADLVPDGWEYDGERLVQWDTPIPPPEGHRILAQMANAFPEATMSKAGRSYLGKTTWALELSPPVDATHRSMAKATTYKPTVVYSARQHANEVSSTSHVLRHAELLLTDPAWKEKLQDVNVVIHPFTNPDGAQLAYDLYRETPDYILHAGYLGSLGMDATSGGGSDFPIYPESKVRGRLWDRWLPDIFLNPHGYPSHQVVQLFSEYTGLVRRGRITERNWGFNKGWFMPGFGYVDNPRYPRHKDAAFRIRDYITRGINSNRDVHDLNQRSYARYRRYGADYEPDVYRLPMSDSVLIEMPLEGSSGQGGGYNANVTIWSGTTEAPDETAYGEWMELVAKAGLSWDQAILDYLYEGDHEVERSGSTFFGGVTLKMNRPRPPKTEDDDDEGEP